MRKTWQTALILLLALQLAGCGNHSNETTINIKSTPISTETTNLVQTQTVEATAQPTPDPKETIQVEGTAQTLYRMNNVFRFEPLDKLAPKKAVLLTFDDGPNDETTLKSILDTLDKHNAKAIFFVNGYQVKQHPDLLKLIHERKQTIGNHSYDHISLRKEKAEVVEKQLTGVQIEVKQLTGVVPKFFRPPYGEGSDLVRKIAKDHGMLYMTWSNGSLDWDKTAKNKPDVVIKNVMEQLHPGANILMHELKWTADALDELLTKIEADGYSFIDPETIEVTH
ncbi:polysaccharide deacetylase family protein [Paenibacillus sp. GSMTC-2017]|uniref:polysaccharide deacetylase family protein n=1 Tax=Paenibacillus sp. GSMTC-2017 TaxID=2794350 RepID=UPI0018D66B59|nr:polysaccharide deacetylase family protein [Paenibacillus sp. GSMTC-2017]MBH5317990.1 polysaccharide deacetylase family protein [Paenibacillus sp. GSMTC-2017]